MKIFQYLSLGLVVVAMLVLPVLGGSVYAQMRDHSMFGGGGSTGGGSGNPTGADFPSSDDSGVVPTGPIERADDNSDSAPDSFIDSDTLPTDGSGGSGSDSSGLTFNNPFSGGDSIFEFITTILNNIILPIGAVIVVIMLIWSGFLFVKARGKPEEIETAKKAFLGTVIGAAILLGSVAIAAAIEGTLCQITTIPGVCE